METQEKDLLSELKSARAQKRIKAPLVMPEPDRIALLLSQGIDIKDSDKTSEMISSLKKYIHSDNCIEDLEYRLDKDKVSFDAEKKNVRDEALFAIVAPQMIEIADALLSDEVFITPYLKHAKSYSELKAQSVLYRMNPNLNAELLDKRDMNDMLKAVILEKIIPSQKESLAKLKHTRDNLEEDVLRKIGELFLYDTSVYSDIEMLKRHFIGELNAVKQKIYLTKLMKKDDSGRTNEMIRKSVEKKRTFTEKIFGRIPEYIVDFESVKPSEIIAKPFAEEMYEENKDNKQEIYSFLKNKLKMGKAEIELAVEEKNLENLIEKKFVQRVSESNILDLLEVNDYSSTGVDSDGKIIDFSLLKRNEKTFIGQKVKLYPRGIKDSKSLLKCDHGGEKKPGVEGTVKHIQDEDDILVLKLDDGHNWTVKSREVEFAYLQNRIDETSIANLAKDSPYQNEISRFARLIELAKPTAKTKKEYKGIIDENDFDAKKVAKLIGDGIDVHTFLVNGYDTGIKNSVREDELVKKILEKDHLIKNCEEFVQKTLYQ